MSKVMLITGAGRGIGAWTARLAADGGYTVVVNYRTNVAAAEQVVSEIRGRGGNAVAVAADEIRVVDVVAAVAVAETTMDRTSSRRSCTSTVSRRSSKAADASPLPRSWSWETELAGLASAWAARTRFPRPSARAA